MTSAVVGWPSPCWALFVNQLAPFLPSCPITARYNVIPAGYNERLHADSSPNFSVTKPLRHAELIDKPGLTKEKIIRQKRQTILEMLVTPTVSLCYSDPW